MRHQVALAIILPPPLRLCARPANRVPWTSMCSNRFCLGEFWCVEWDCCSSMGDPPPSKQRRPLEAVSPLRSLSSLWSRFAGGLFRKTRKNVLAGLCECSRSGGRNEIVSTRRVVPKISWKNQNQTIGWPDLWSRSGGRTVSHIRRPPLGVYWLGCTATVVSVFRPELCVQIS